MISKKEIYESLNEFFYKLSPRVLFSNKSGHVNLVIVLVKVSKELSVEVAP